MKTRKSAVPLPGAEQRLLRGRYRLEREIARTEMSVVYDAIDENGVWRRRVAIKMLLDALRGDPVEVARFAAEARNLASVQHPAVVQVYDVAIDREAAFLVMEFVSGARTLRQLLAEAGRLTPERAAALVAEIARGIAAVHAQGIVHLDVKPENVLIAPDGRPKLADFGLSRSRGDTAPLRWGTLAYLDPRVRDGASPDDSTDRYALGVMLVELVTGALPSPGVASTRGVPAGIRRVVELAMHPDPDERYRRTDDLARDLEAFVAEHGRPHLLPTQVLTRVIATRTLDRLDEAHGAPGARGDRLGHAPDAIADESGTRADGRWRSIGTRVLTWAQRSVFPPRRGEAPFDAQARRAEVLPSRVLLACVPYALTWLCHLGPTSLADWWRAVPASVLAVAHKCAHLLGLIFAQPLRDSWLAGLVALLWIVLPWLVMLALVRYRPLWRSVLYWTAFSFVHSSAGLFALAHFELLTPVPSLVGEAPFEVVVFGRIAVPVPLAVLYIGVGSLLSGLGLILIKLWSLLEARRAIRAG